ncbi:MAG: RES domain-containing protein [Betaproteobacteria bacterium]|nr:RES domain-containing protein [Betaproteobacteria bacterium]MDE2621634.1 RES domain-containing protein [Betaproteobacteria bacterium]
MQAWRITKRIHALDQTATGAFKYGGRWNAPGTSAIYAALSIELAALEKLVHVGNVLPTDLVLVVIDLPDQESLFEEATLQTLPPGWNTLPSSASAAPFGTSFLTTGQKLGLIVPSVIIPETRNIVINPGHAAFKNVSMRIERDFEFDHRFRK